MILLDVLQEALRGRLDEIQDVFEALGAAIEGVRHLSLRRAYGKFQEGTDLGSPPAKRSNRPVVRLVHRENVIEALTVVACNLARPLGAEVQTPRARAPLRPLVRRRPGVPGSGPGGIHENLALKTLAPQDVLEDTLS